MDFRAVKIILAAFLFIAFVTPFFRLSVAMPKKGKHDDVTYVKPEIAGLAPTQNTTLAFIVSGSQVDSTTVRVSDTRK